MRESGEGCETREDARRKYEARMRRASTCATCGHPICDHPGGNVWGNQTGSSACVRHDDGTNRPYVEQQGQPCGCARFVPVETLR